MDTAVTVIEYGDYECNYCRQVQPIIQEIQGLLGQQITYVFRHFPITSTHPHAQLAAEAAEAAAAQGKFWEMHNQLLAYDGVPDQPHLNQTAVELGLDVAQFEQDLDEHTFHERVRRDFVGGIRSGANGTPTFFINGVRYDGAWDRESLLEAITKPLGIRAKLLAQEFMSLTASGGIVLLLATIMALIWANVAPES
jgi:protein-disulfide isomerase